MKFGEQGPMIAGGGEDQSHVRFDQVRAAYGNRLVFKSLSCTFPRGKISVILGGSGSGKSTILRLMGGLLRPLSGAIVIDGQDIAQLSERQMQAIRPKLGMMFQGGALLDSYTVFENLALPLREHTNLGPAPIADAVHAGLQAVGLNDIDKLLPNELSGGMVRRVALARAVIRKPVILMCDEPFSGLDPSSIKRIESLFQKMNHDLGITMVVVSHHIPSTLRMADHVVLLLPDRVVEGSPSQLKESVDPEVADFLNEEAGPQPSPSALRGGGVMKQTP